MRIESGEAGRKNELMRAGIRRSHLLIIIFCMILSRECLADDWNCAFYKAEPPEDRSLLAVMPLNVVLVSDAVAQAEQIQRAAAGETIAIVYHSNSMTATGLVDLLASVSAAHNGARIGHLGIVAHGGPGELYLGKDSDISLATLPNQAPTLQRLRSVFTRNARLDLYACSVAAGADGKTFVDELSVVTGAAVFASDNPIGTVHGADFVWEYHTGQAAAGDELFSLREFESIPQLLMLQPTAAIDQHLLTLIDQYAPTYYRSTWNMNIEEFKAFIATIAWGEGGNGGYTAHSSVQGTDKFTHSSNVIDPTTGYQFSFSTGIGPFQLDNGGLGGVAGLGTWSTWPTIDKLDPSKAVQTVMYQWYTTFSTAGTTLQTFANNSPWFAVNPAYGGDVSGLWMEVTGTSWSTYSSGNVALNWSTIEAQLATNASNTSFYGYASNVQNVGSKTWNIGASVGLHTESGKSVIFTGAHETWLITDRTGGGTVRFQYYYTYDASSNIEVWVFNNASASQNALYYIFERECNGQYPERYRTNPGDTLSSAALNVGTNTTPPGAFSKISPPNNTTPVTSRNVQFSWNPSSGSGIKYNLTVHDELQNPVPGCCPTGLTNTYVTCTIPNKYGARYYWDVWAVNSAGSTEADAGMLPNPWYSFWAELLDDLTISTTNLTLPSTTQGTAGATTNFTVTGVGLQDVDYLTLTPPIGCEISLNSSSGFASTPINLYPNTSSGILSITTIYAQISSKATSDVNGSLTIQGHSKLSLLKSIQVSGSVLAAKQTYNLANGFTTISFPFVPIGPEGTSKFSDVFGQKITSGDVLDYVAHINDSTGIMEFILDQDTPLLPKKGYLVYAFKPNVSLTVSGQSISDPTITINHPHTWSLLGVLTSGPIPSNPKLDNIGFDIRKEGPHITDIFSENLEPGRGYFVAAIGTPPITVISKSQAPKEVLSAKAMNVPQSAVIGSDFGVAITVTQAPWPGLNTPNSKTVTFGIKPGATDAYDKGVDQISDFPLPEDIYAFLMTPGMTELKEDYRASANSVSWTLDVTSQGGYPGKGPNLNPVMISWSIPSTGVSPDAHFELRNSTGSIIVSDMRASSSVLLFTPFAAGEEHQFIVHSYLEAATYTLSTSVPGGHGKLVASGSNPYSAGTVVTLTATPDQGYQVRNWNGTDNDGIKATTNAVTMSGDKSVTVDFELIPDTCTITISDASVTEGNSGTIDCTFNVVLSQTSSQAVTVHYSTADGSAKLADNDYQSANSTLTIPAGQISGSIIVKVVGDTKVEPNEYFVVNLSNPSGATLLRSQGEGTIINDDQQAGIAGTATTLGVSASSIVYGQSITFTATVAVVPPGTGTPTSGTVTFLDGSTILGSAAVSAGTATFATTSLAVGQHLITASYSGDGANFAGSSTTIGPNSIISTVAGSGKYGFSGDEGPATSATMRYPIAVAVDNAGNIYFADSGNQRVRKADVSTGVITTVVGKGTGAYNGDNILATSATLNNPDGIVVDAAGNIYVADGGNQRVRKINVATGIIATIAGTGTAGYSGDGDLATAAELRLPTGLALDNNNLYIADRGNFAIRKVDLITKKITTVAGTGTAGYSGDGDLATAAKLNHPWGIAVDEYENMFISDQDNSVIRKVTYSTGKISTIVGTGAQGHSGDGGKATAATLWSPCGIALDTAGNLYIADSNIREVNLASGIITTAAGSSAYAGYNGDDIPATSAWLNSPEDVTVDAKGNVFIADYMNLRIRQVTPGVAISVTAAPISPTGRVEVNVTPPNATWSFQDGQGGNHSGAGNKAFDRIPVGTITITWNSLTNYDKPPSSSETLLASGVVTFQEIYLNTDPVERKCAQILRYLLGMDTVPTGLDLNSDGVVSVADLMTNRIAAYPVVSTFAINNGSASTASRSVTLNNTCTGSPSYYMASESSSFSRATWQTYSKAPSFTLSTGNGTKTVYFKLKNASGHESTPKSDVITLSSPSSYMLTLNIDPTGGGSINANPPPGNDGKYTIGTVVTLTANLASGYSFGFWSGDLPNAEMVGGQLNITGPSARATPAMAYDSARQCIILFGGFGDTTFGDTWEWDGSLWHLKSTVGPSARSGSAMAYDSARQRIVLFGGWNISWLGDTWEWDGSLWHQVSTTGPSARSGSANAYDSVRQQFIVFGGFGGDGFPVTFGDTWMWDGNLWHQVSTTGPSARSGSAMAYDSTRQRTVLFGGLDDKNGGQLLGDTWEWDGSQWHQVSSTGPSTRYCHAMAYDSARQRTLLFGGTNDSGSLGDTWEWDGSQWHQVSSTGPFARADHAMAYDSTRQRIMLFGGSSNSQGSFGDTWELKPYNPISITMDNNKSITASFTRPR